MRIAVFSDVHGNLEALEAFLERIREQDVDRICCLGDLVGYGPNPNECVEMVRSLPGINVVLGNHDWAMNNQGSLSVDMSPVALEGIQWTDRYLTPENRTYLKSLPTSIDMGPFTFVHASSFRPLRWQYLRPGKPFRTWLCMRYAAGRIVAIGHTHAPAIMDAQGSAIMPDNDFSDAMEFQDDGHSRFLVNPGSIGQPRDKLLRPSYMIYDTRSMKMTWHRLTEYDCFITLRKILHSGLPDDSAWLLLA
jgi:predicted phosphodiesterase